MHPTPRLHPSGLALIAALLLLPAAVLPSVAAPATAKPAKAAHSVLPFIDDDLPRALAEAKQRDLPLFVESWAPW